MKELGGKEAAQKKLSTLAKFVLGQTELAETNLWQDHLIEIVEEISLRRVHQPLDVRVARRLTRGRNPMSL